MGLAATYGVYGSVIAEQTDFVCELRNQCKYAANFGKCSYVTVPAPYPEVCTTECLVMDYVQGVRLDHLTRIQGERRTDAIADVMVASLLIHGFVHCDGHLGNCFAYPNDERRIAIIDFGICHQFSPGEVDHLYEFLHTVALKECESPGTCFLRHFTDYPRRSRPDSRLVKDLDNVFNTVFHVSGCFSVAEMSSLYNVLSAHGISTVEAWKKLEITLAALDSVFRRGGRGDTPLVHTILRKIRNMDRLLAI
jgi:predicted unusual protein kinase regulating ubiquinone biosynthesis (AarF/ABC1/UbiB family)